MNVASLTIKELKQLRAHCLATAELATELITKAEQDSSRSNARKGRRRDTEEQMLMVIRSSMH